MPKEENGREGRHRGLPVGEDAAHLWHVLDKVLSDLCGVRDELAEAGLEDCVECLQGPIEKVEVRYSETEREVARLLGNGWEESRW